MNVLNGEHYKNPPVWLMRQAGRYLPEYKQVRKNVGGFLDLCYTPEKAIEVTLQPIKRFGFDAAILFSDILVVPDAMDRKVWFIEGEGPRLEPISVGDIEKIIENRELVDNAMTYLGPVFETVAGLRIDLPMDTTLLGFCGAPWTVATYMIAGRGTSDQAPARLFSFTHEKEFRQLLNLIADVSVSYLVKQLQAGADAVQIFDSWSGVLGNDEFENFCVAPVKRIVDGVRAVIPDAKIIGFPKGAGFNYLSYAQKTGVNCLSLDWSIPFKVGIELQNNCPIQGNLDPMRLISGGKALDEGIDNILKNFGSGPLIFNLGHGITPNTPISNVEHLIKRLRY